MLIVLKFQQTYAFLVKRKRKAEYRGQLAAWKMKESGWEKIEPMAVAFGNTSLFHKVKDINLFAAEAQYYDIDFVIIPFSEH